MSDTLAVDLTAIPGADLIQAGLQDAAAGRETIASLLVALGAPRLKRAGLEIPDFAVEDPDYRLYHLLAAEDSDCAHSRYNALLRQLSSFAHALDRLPEASAVDKPAL